MATGQKSEERCETDQSPTDPELASPGVAGRLVMQFFVDGVGYHLGVGTKGSLDRPIANNAALFTKHCKHSQARSPSALHQLSIRESEPP
jgi:hypothetical protein